MRLIFLDMDGVLNSVRSTVAAQKSWIDTLPYYDHEEQSLDPVAVNLLKVLCNKSGAEIVISSTWRIGRTIEDFVKIFNFYGWDDFPIVGMTPKLNGKRGTEIALWMSSHEEPIESYVILDDDSDMLEEQMTQFVHVNQRDGLSLKNYVDALALFTGNSNEVRDLSYYFEGPNYE